VRITVVGAGAIGCLFGARLAAHGHDVVLVVRPRAVADLRAQGLRVEGRDPGHWNVAVSAEPPTSPAPELALLAVKAFDLPGAASGLATRVRTPIPVLLPQNGLGLESGTAAAMRRSGWSAPELSLVRAVNTIPATWVAPGVVRQPGNGELIVADPDGSGRSGPAIRTWRSVLVGAGFSVRTVAELDRELWRKALVNAAINPVTALHRIPNGRLRESPYREEAETLLREAQRAAGAAGFPFSDAEADRSLDQVVRATAENRSSMLQDVERGRPTEIDSISGEIVRTAAAHGIDLPATRAVLDRVVARTSSAAARAQPS
jgi:2-dehydropantoate 2-reductase